MKKILLLGLLALLAKEASGQGYETVPYGCDFESSAGGAPLPAGWLAPQTGTLGGQTLPRVDSLSGQAHSGSNYLLFETTSGDTEVVVLPPMTDISSLKLTFWSSALWSQLPTWFEVGVWESQRGAFSPVDTVSLYLGNQWGDYNEYTVYFTGYSGEGDRIALRACGGHYTLLVDDVRVSENNGCYPLSSLYVAGSDMGSITVGWTDERNEGAYYTVSYWQEGATDTVTVTGLDSTHYTARGLGSRRIYHFSVKANCATGDGDALERAFTSPCSNVCCLSSVSGLTAETPEDSVIRLSWHRLEGVSGYAIYQNGEFTDFVTDTAYVFSSLERNRGYSVGVRGVCDGGDSTDLTSVEVCTGCGEMTLPFFEDFDSYSAPSWPPCWHRLESSGGLAEVRQQYHYSGRHSIYLVASGERLVFCAPTPVPTAGNNIYVRYRALLTAVPYPRGEKWLKGGVLTDTTDLTTFVALDSMDVHDVEDVFVERDFHTQGLDSGATYWVAWMFYSAENYIHGWGDDRGAVDNIFIGEIPSCLHVSSIGAESVTDSSITLTWVEHELNTEVGFTVSCWADGGDTTTLSTLDTFLVFNNLNENTYYNFSIAMDCDEGEVVTARFRTACRALPVPYVEGFEVQSPEETPDCWSSLGGPVLSRTGNVHGGTRYLDFSCLSANMYSPYNYYATPTVAVLPVLAEETNRLQMTFWTRPGNAYSNYGSFSVGYLTDPDDEGSFTVLDSYNYSDFGGHGQVEWQKKRVLFVDVPEGARMAFRYNALATGYHWYVDDIEVDTLPSCLPVKNLEVTGLTAIEATLRWTPREGQSAWLVMLDSTVYSTVDTTFSLTGLRPHTLYSARVASLCGCDTSMWKRVDFKTLCTMGSSEVTVCMAARWNGGWSGSSVDIYQDSVLEGSATFGTGRNDTARVEVCCGVPVIFNWNGGPFGLNDFDCSYIVYDGNMGEVYNSAHGGVALGGTIMNVCASCEVPGRVRMSRVDSTSITLCWDTVEGALGYRVSMDGTVPVITNSGSYTFTGLTADSSYVFRVSTLCNPRSGSNTVTFGARTTCGAMTLPVKEYFDNTPLDAVPECWYRVGGYPGVRSYAEYHTPTKSLEMMSGSTLATQRVPLEGDLIGVDFWVSHYYGTFEAGVMTNVADESSFMPLVASTGTGDTGIHIAFSTRTLPHDSCYHVAFRLSGSVGSCYLDDVQIFEDTSVAHYTLIASPNDTSMGSVTGGGRYVEGYIAALTATPKPGYRFVEWDDGWADSLRSVAVTGDLSFEARFATHVDIEEIGNPESGIAIYPNPASEEVTVRVEQPSVLSLIDITGRTLLPPTSIAPDTNLQLSTLNSQFSISNLPPGPYFLRIATAAGIVTKKLIIR